MKLVTRPMLSRLRPAPWMSARRLRHAFANCVSGSCGTSPVWRSTPRIPEVKNNFPAITRSGDTAPEGARPGSEKLRRLAKRCPFHESVARAPPGVDSQLGQRFRPPEGELFVAVLVDGAAHAQAANHLAVAAQRPAAVQRRQVRVRPVGH